ncbi:MAG: DNA methyltransferase [Pseudomonadota bacterium]
MNGDPSIRDHKAWIGYLQPDGLVVSPAALVDAQVLLPREGAARQEAFAQMVEERELESGDTVSLIPNLARFLHEFLEWPQDCVYGLDPVRPIPESLSVQLPELGETLSPQFAFRDVRAGDAAPWLILGQWHPAGADLDAVHTGSDAKWSASLSRRFERLLRETGVPIGIISNGTSLRLVYAPRGENPGTLTFPVSAMCEVAGRPILAALELLLHRIRLLSAPSEARLPALLTRSREYQSRVSTALAQQVLDALYELVRGFQAANERTNGELLRGPLTQKPDEVYAGLLNVLLRLVFLLYAEDRGLTPGSSLYLGHYSVHGLFERLRADEERYPDTMDHRFGAWAQLLALFRAVHGGSRHPQLAMPARSGYLFDPARFPFLEGGATKVPLVPDGVVYRVLRKLLVLEGERLSYRTLDVEQIGSVYETMMGFRLELTRGNTIALKPAKARGAPTAVNLDELLDVRPAERSKWLRERTDQKLTGEAENAVKGAQGVDALLAALERRIARNATPNALPAGTMVLQPTDERRRSGSHYTPRSLTEPIVRTALKPVLERLGDKPTAEQILDLKICDPAVGSGAFLVEACRQLAEVLIEAWQTHGKLPTIPADEDEILYARRLVAQRCLYGVDRNPLATDLAKLSLWLATLARDHPFTFLDHAIRSGDSLVGLTRQQIADFHWKPEPRRVLGQDLLERRIDGATKARKEILEADEELVGPALKRQKLDLADEALSLVRFAGDCVIAAFFAADKDRARNQKRDELLMQFNAYLERQDLAADRAVSALRADPFPVRPFHWQVEFPEVFDRENGGFDAIVGNPPFAGKNTLINGNREGYLDWLQALHEETHGNSDLVAHFFRRAFSALRSGGTFGLIATNTIGQGDTRYSGLRWICTHGGTIYAARKRYKWPGEAAVVVSIVYVSKGSPREPNDLDGRAVRQITAYLFHAGGHEHPAVLKGNAGRSFQGSIVLGMGFTFDDTGTRGIATPISEMERLISKDARNKERIFPYIGGEEVNDDPRHRHHRYIINFEDMPLARKDLGKKWSGAGEEQHNAWLRSGFVPLDYPGPVASDWPDLLEIVDRKVRPERETDNRASYRRYWWQFAEKRVELTRALSNIHGTGKVLVTNCGATPHLAFARLDPRMVFANSLAVVTSESSAMFCVLQSRIHEVWARFFASSLEDRLRYTPSDCFETFPFPLDLNSSKALADAGGEYYEHRAALMIGTGEGLTKTYNRFNDPDEASADILELRLLHSKMDRAVLDAYGWPESSPECEFILEYEDEGESGEEASRRKKPWRYRWPNDFRDGVLAKLLVLNAERAREEGLAVTANAVPLSGSPSRPRKGRNRTVSTTDLFDL